jgi:hypothetical protein
MAVKVEIPDGSWHSTDDLTGKELEAIEKVTGTSWSLLNPLREIATYRAIVAAFTIRFLDMSDAEISDWFDARTAKELGAGIAAADEGGDLPGSYEDGLPLAAPADEPSTSSSADSQSRRGDGLPT